MLLEGLRSQAKHDGRCPTVKVSEANVLLRAMLKVQDTNLAPVWGPGMENPGPLSLTGAELSGLVSN